MSSRAAVIGLVIVLLFAGGGVWKWRSGLTPHYEKATVCGVRTALAEDLLGTDRFVERYGFGKSCSTLVGGAGSEDGELGSVVATASVEQNDWEGEHRRISVAKRSFAVAGGRAYVDGSGRSARGFWACDLGPDVVGGGTVATIGAAGVSQRPVSLGDLRVMVAEVAGAVGCGARG